MSTSYGNNLAGAAAAAFAVGFLVTPAPAQAAPADCNGYEFPAGTVSLHQPKSGATTTFDTAAGGPHVDTRGLTDYPEGGDMPGGVVGDIKGNSITLKVTREGGSRDYPALNFTGQVGADDRGHGSFTYKGGEGGSWDSVEPMKCIPKPAAPAPAANEPVPVGPAPNPVPQEVAAPANAGTAPTEAQAPPPEEATARPPQQANQPCIPDPFDLNFPGAC
jgi:hypothetical protein